MQLNNAPMPLARDAPACAPAVGAALLAAAMALPLAAQADSAPERGLLAFKYLDYQDSQPGADRIAVRSPAFSLLAPMGSDWAVGGTLTSDVISGASPAYHTSGLGRMFDHRRAGAVDLTRYFANGSLTLGANLSSEHDYLSRGVSLQATRSNESKNTTWMLGLGYNSDDINPTNHVVANETKHVSDALAGVTQVLTVDDIVQLNVGFSWGTGYYSDPYKIVDNRPREHNHGTAMARWNHFFDASGGTSRASYRYFADNWGIRAHTLELEYVQPLAGGWTLTPLARLYTQTAARFYVDADPSIYPFAPNPPDGAIYYSEDQRLSAFGAHTLGLKVAKQLDDNWTVDVKLERYEQRAGWALLGSGSPDLAAFRYRAVQLGLARQF